MSHRGFTKAIFKKKLGPVYVSLHKTTAVSIISDTSYWHDLYILFGKKLELTARW